jgi:hypothetical protein
MIPQSTITPATEAAIVIIVFLSNVIVKYNGIKVFAVKRRQYN